MSIICIFHWNFTWLYGTLTFFIIEIIFLLKGEKEPHSPCEFLIPLKVCIIPFAVSANRLHISEIQSKSICNVVIHIIPFHKKNKKFSGLL